MTICAHVCIGGGGGWARWAWHWMAKVFALCTWQWHSRRMRWPGRAGRPASQPARQARSLAAGGWQQMAGFQLPSGAAKVAVY
jgi:hypothetical protein